MSELDDLLRRVGEEQDQLRARSGLAERVASRVRAVPERRRRSVRLWMPLAAAVTFAAVLLGLYAFRPAPALSLRVGDASGAPLVGAWLGAPDGAALPLDFSDGSRFELTPKSRARVVELSPARARVELASGSLNVHVAPGRGIGWRIDAGPFGVRITGTRFAVSYVPDIDTFELSVTEGQVELSGCMFGSGRKLAMGQRVRASCTARKLEVSYADVAESAPDHAATPPAASATALAAPPSETAAPAPDTPESTRPAPASASGDDWLALARAGKYAEAYAAADREGFEAASLRASPEALTLLAEVARHARKPRRAEESLLALRRRFPASNEAALAAFTLGRIAFDEHRSYSAASEWFRTYLRERPGGVMAREALGRLLEASHRAQDTASARALAERYLREYPTGPHAELASRLVASP